MCFRWKPHVVLVGITRGFDRNHVRFWVEPHVVWSETTRGFLPHNKSAVNFFKSGFFQRRQNPGAGSVVHTYSPDGVGRYILFLRFTPAADGRVKTAQFFEPYNAPLRQQVLGYIFQCINNTRISDSERALNFSMFFTSSSTVASFPYTICA